MNEKKIDVGYIKKELDKVIKTLKPDSVFSYSSLYGIATHFYKLGIDKGYRQAIDDVCELIVQQQEMLEDCFSDANDFADLVREATLKEGI